MVEQESRRIRSLREALKLTQEEFARERGVSFTTVSRWENGHGKPSRLARRQLEELAARLGGRVADPGKRGAR
ncbi:MAG: XRE family transcriptional regulator [Myxococcales bacterium]|nr:XRE family transcriptional regulator [Myxococcales bacterium]